MNFLAVFEILREIRGITGVVECAQLLGTTRLSKSTCRYVSYLRLAGVYIRICIYTYIYSVYCFSPNLARVITSSAFIALEIKKLLCLGLVEIYRMTR